MNKIIIGLVSQMASGKGTATEYLHDKYGANIYRFSTVLRDVADRLYITQSRENLQEISRVLREQFGEDLLSKVIAEDVKNDAGKIICIDGFRRPEELDYLSKLPGFVLVHICTDMRIRYERITRRSENTDDQQKTFEQFQTDHQQEAEQNIDKVITLSTEKINNNGTVEQLQLQLDALLEKYS